MGSEHNESPVGSFQKSLVIVIFVRTDAASLLTKAHHFSCISHFALIAEVVVLFLLGLHLGKHQYLLRLRRNDNCLISMSIPFNIYSHNCLLIADQMLSNVKHFVANLKAKSQHLVTCTSRCGMRRTTACCCAVLTHHRIELLPVCDVSYAVLDRCNTFLLMLLNIVNVPARVKYVKVVCGTFVLQFANLPHLKTFINRGHKSDLFLFLILLYRVISCP